ncbi:hypothetical protein SUGI_1024380 [Cryptomeria japonica]|nr:hypothetical protein SUGI_1024380 [Cryptomeria japonica]
MMVILAMAVPGVGLWAHYGDWRQFGYVKTPMQLFLVWNVFGNRDERQVEAQMGWESLKDFLNTWELEWKTLPLE